jgi:tetratricopeptide (TPR) repeat protein
VALIDGRVDQALEKANEATRQLDAGEAASAARGGTPAVRTTEKFYALYQTGLVKARRDDWAGAADAFERAAALDPMFAYAHYYAGLAYSNVKRPDKVAMHFDHFLRIAPNAPERSAVMSIMRTIRGR